MNEGPDSIRRLMAERLSANKPEKIRASGLVPSAVLVPLFVKDNDWRMLLTMRSQEVATHKGQISFPGGAVDRHDKSMLDAALRETHEEIGVEPKDVQVLGELDDIFTITNFRVTPFVGVVPYPYPYRVSAREIDRLIEVPVDALLHNEHFEASFVEYEGCKYPIFSFFYDGDVIWGATAKIITHFLSVAFGFDAPGLDCDTWSDLEVSPFINGWPKG